MNRRDPSQAEIERAAEELRAGGIVAFPTETVYGLGADARNPDAVRRVFAAKGRPADHPLIVHLASADAFDAWAARVPAPARVLAERFWPGPLTLILPRRPEVPDAVTGGQDTVGLRVPDHPVAAALLRAFGGGIAAPSANRFGRVSATTAAHVREEFGEEVATVLDGGPCRVGVESTIVDLSGDEPTILRLGGVPEEALRDALGRALPRRLQGGPVRSPGALPSHYAPRAAVELVDASRLAPRAAELVAAGRRVGVLAPEPLPQLPAAVVRLAIPADPAAAAPLLYDRLREADRQRLEIVIAVAPHESGLGAAIADRLRRAAAPRPGDTGASDAT